MSECERAKSQLGPSGYGLHTPSFRHDDLCEVVVQHWDGEGSNPCRCRDRRIAALEVENKRLSLLLKSEQLFSRSHGHDPCRERITLLEAALAEARREYEGPMSEEIQALKQALAEAQLKGHQESDAEWVKEYAAVRDERDSLQQALAEAKADYQGLLNADRQHETYLDGVIDQLHKDLAERTRERDEWKDLIEGKGDDETPLHRMR